MAVMTHPENYVTLRWQRASTATLAAELAGVLQAADREGSNADAAARRTLLAIEHALSYAHELYHKRRYQEAIDTYKQAQARIYQQLDRSFPLSAALRPELVFPLSAILFQPLLAASLEMVEALDPRVAEADFGPAFVNVPQDALRGLADYGDLGLTPADGVPRAAREASTLAARYAERGQWRRAEFFYKQAQTALGAQASREARAAVDLSLGGVLIEMGRTADARQLIASAAAAFAASKDLVGQAQASVNLAAILAREGQHAEAAKALQQAERLLTQAKGLPTPDGPSPPPPPAPPSPTAAGRDTLARFVTATNLGRLLAAQPRLTPAVERLVTTIPADRVGSTRLDTLDDLPQTKGLAVTFRQPGGGWSTAPVEPRAEAAEKQVVKRLGIMVGNDLRRVQWQAGEPVPATSIIDGVYQARIAHAKLVDLEWRPESPSGFAVQLPHLYYYVIPVALGDCYNALGEFDTAERYYLQAADYQFINTAIEVPALWHKIAENVLEWGDRLYRNAESQADFQDALAVYRKVAEPLGTPSVVPAGAPLYAHATLRTVGDRVRDLLANPTAGPGALSPAVAGTVLTIRVRLIQLNAGLDFLGTPIDIVPIWSFEFLQNVARYFAQQAVQAEREFISFQDRGENEAFTRQQLEQAKALAAAEKELARQQREAAEAEAAVYQEGKELATLRAQQAAQNRTDYAAMTAERIYHDAALATLGAGSNVDWSVIEEHIRRLQEEGRTSGERGHLIGAHTLERGRMTREYELAAMGRQTAELQQAEAVAQVQLNAANARVEAAQQAEQVAALREQAAQEHVDAFDNQFFTPDVWYQMGGFMRRIASSYFLMALRVARLMQRAYNFENDLDRRFIKTDYSTDTVKGMLAADALLLDIDSLTYDLITTVKRKQLPVKETTSLAERFPFQFETQLRRTGRIDFETRVEDFDLAYPGTYARRIESVEVEVEGILPRSGVRGTLTNGGISRYRTPDIDQVKVRIQPRETLVLSEYRVKDDAIVFPADPRTLKVFEGAGVASTWSLEISRASNDLDFSTITDVRITFYYHSRYDAGLANAVKAQLAALAGIASRARMIPLRWMFPDAFFYFQDTGQLAFSLSALDFPFNEQNPQIRRVALLLTTEPGTNPSAWQVRLGVPAHPATMAASPNAQGEISITAGHPWTPLAAGAALGDYLVEIRADENPALAQNGVIKLDPIQNIVLILEYQYTPRV